MLGPALDKAMLGAALNTFEAMLGAALDKKLCLELRYRHQLDSTFCHRVT